jgi:polyhydroxybutyrate depolymerase
VAAAAGRKGGPRRRQLHHRGRRRHRQNLSIDSAKVYATGMSNGAIMSYALAAIGPVSGTQLNPCRSPHPTSVMHIHGTTDRLIPHHRGQGAGVAHINGPSAPEVNAFWRNVDHCGAAATTTSGSIATSTAGCADNRSLVLITVDGSGHHWPSFATQKLWQFFAAHPVEHYTSCAVVEKV